MKYVFIDEIKGEKDPSLYGISFICIDSSKYHNIRDIFLKKLKQCDWSENEEFKGRFLFANNPAGQTKTPADMINLTSEIITELSSAKNSRANIFYSYNKKGATLQNFCELVSRVILKLPRPASKKSGKHLAQVYFDYFDGCCNSENLKRINRQISDALRKRNYLLIEDSSTPVHSSNYSVGIIYADVCAYLCKWQIENPGIKNCTLIDLIEHTKNEKITVVNNICAQIKKIILVE